MPGADEGEGGVVQILSAETELLFTLAQRSYVWTLNNPTDHDMERLLVNLDVSLPTMDGIRYTVVGLETGQQGTLHLQGYSELSRPMRIPQFQRILLENNPQRLHVERRRGTREQARNYIADDQKEGSDGWVEAGSWIGGQGDRSDLGEIQMMIHQRVPMDVIAKEHFEVWCRNYRALQTYQTLSLSASSPTWRTLHVKVYWGKTGAGKSRAARDACDSYYAIHNPEGPLWFDLYHGHTRLILEDFSGWIKLSYLLVLLDGYELRLPIKGGHTIALWTEVILTSNLPPHLWYTPEAMTKHPGALARRVNEIHYFDDTGSRIVPWGWEQ